MSVSEVLDGNQPAPGLRVQNATITGELDCGGFSVNKPSGKEYLYLYDYLAPGFAEIRGMGVFVAPSWSASLQYAQHSLVSYPLGGGLTGIYRATGAPAVGVAPPGAGWTFLGTPWSSTYAYPVGFASVLYNGDVWTSAAPVLGTPPAVPAWTFVGPASAGSANTQLVQSIDSLLESSPPGSTTGTGSFTTTLGVNGRAGAGQLILTTTFNGATTVASSGDLRWSPQGGTAYTPVAESGAVMWNTVQKGGLLAQTEFVNARGGGGAPGGFVFLDGLDGAAPAGLTKIGQFTTQTVGVIDYGQMDTGVARVEGVVVAPTLFDPSIGAGTLDGAGTLTVATSASDPASHIFCQYTGAGPYATALTVSAQTTTNFTVNGVANAPFKWWIVSPNYAS